MSLATFIIRWCGIPSVHPNALGDDDVHSIVSAYEPEVVTDRLETFGRFLLTANCDRTKDLEQKAVLLMGYSIAVIVFLVSREPSQSVLEPPWPPVMIRLASIFAGISLVFSFLALRVRLHAWFGDRQWFDNEGDTMDEPDLLHRAHVLAIHAVNSRLTLSNDEKADNIIVAQGCLIIAGLLLAVWIVMR
jgi:hypothetical protein